MRNLLGVVVVLFVMACSSVAQAGPPGCYGNVRGYGYNNGYNSGYRGYYSNNLRPVPRVSLYGVGAPGLYPSRFDFGGGGYGGGYYGGQGYGGGYYGNGYNGGGYYGDGAQVIINVGGY